MTFLDAYPTTLFGEGLDKDGYFLTDLSLWLSAISNDIAIMGWLFYFDKSKITEKLLIDWNDIRLNHIDLFTDKKSAQPNLEGFHENRHDQSIFSMLVKQLPHIEISWKEVEPLDGIWEGFENSPIQGKRARSVSKKKKNLLRSFIEP